MLLVSIDQKTFVRTWSKYIKVGEWEKIIMTCSFTELVV